MKLKPPKPTPEDEKLPSGRKTASVQDELIGPRPVLTSSALKSLLQQFNLKVTSQRLAVLKALSTGARKHLTAREIFEKVLRTHSDVAFATIYRFIKTLNKKGVISQLKMSGVATRYELKSEKHHHHITCVQCGKIIEFQNNKIENMIKEVIKKHHFSLKHHIIQLYGECGRPCKKQS